MSIRETIIEKLSDKFAPDYLEVIAGIDDRYSHVMLFAHNPTITDCANRLTDTFTDDLPTCAIVGFSNSGSWKAFASGFNERILYDYPKNNTLTIG